MKILWEPRCADRFTSCGKGQLLWNWTVNKIAAILRTAANHIPQDWLLRPRCAIWPPYQEESCAVAPSTIGCLQTYISRYCDTQGVHRVCTPSERNPPCAAFRTKTRGIIPDCSGRIALSEGTPQCAATYRNSQRED
jgi:hypothetical protein